MDLQNLKEHHEELLSFMENNGYSSTYIRRFREEINRILAKADSHDWQSYRDVYLDYLKAPHSKDYLRNKRTIIGALEQFDDFGRMPDGRSRHTLFERGSYHLLCSEFRELIDFYRIYEKKRGKKESTIRSEALNTASFLHQMQQRGAQCLDAITEEDVLSFFLVEGGSLQRSCSYKKNIAAVFKAGLNWKTKQILVTQQKTSVPLELPLSAVVGNAIYDYLESERPDTGCPRLFLTETHPFSPLSTQEIANIVTKICRIAGVRQNPGDRKGTHIFRHNLASSMLENDIPQSVITQTLGHTAPDSLEPYLRADFVHLKECALSVEQFPLAKEVLSI